MVALCPILFLNLTLTHRLKSFGFNEQEITVEIPKPLLLGDVAVRVMWPPYDPLTPQVEKRSGDDGDKSRPDTEKLSTVADNTESVQLENNEVHVSVCCSLCVASNNAEQLESHTF